MCNKKFHIHCLQVSGELIWLGCIVIRFTKMELLPSPSPKNLVSYNPAVKFLYEDIKKPAYSFSIITNRFFTALRKWKRSSLLARVKKVVYARVPRSEQGKRSSLMISYAINYSRTYFPAYREGDLHINSGLKLSF